MKLDNLLEQMMMMQQQQHSVVHQQQQQIENHGTECQQKAQLTEFEEGRQTQQRRVDILQNGAVGVTNGNLQLSNSDKNFGEMPTTANNVNFKKSDEFEGIPQVSQCQDSFHIPQPTIGISDNNNKESLPQHLEIFSAFLRENLPMSVLSAFSTPSFSPQQNSAFSGPIPHQIVPLSKEIASEGLFAVGGCRPCHKTFTSRLELIHHCVDHFPNVFYSFEEHPTPNNRLSPLQTTKNGTQNVASNGATNLLHSDANSTHKMDFLGQLAGLLAFNENGGHSSNRSASDLLQPFQNASNSLLSNIIKSFGLMPLPFQQLTAAENGKKMDSNNGPAENIREQQRKRTTAASSSVSNSKQPSTRPDSSPNSSKATSGARKRQINHENGVNGKGKMQMEGRPSTSSAGSNKNARKKTIIGGENQRNGNDLAPTTAASSTTPAAMPTLSELPYHMCPHCCLTFAETSAFRTHLSAHESEITASTNQSSTVVEPFTTSVLLSRMDVADAGAETVAHSQQQTMLKCSLCEMKFVNAFRLGEHMRLHSAHTCSQCQKTFMTAFDLNLHMGTHTGFTYDCKDCGKCFPCRKTLAEHNRSHRMILSGDGGGRSASPELPQKAKSGHLSGQDRENSPGFGTLSGDNGSDKKRMRVAKRGEKSRRNATLVAVESAAPSPPLALPAPQAICSTAASSSSSSSSSADVQQFSEEAEKEHTEII